MTGKPVLLEYACFEDSLLSASFELAHGVAYRLGLPRIDLVSEQGRDEYKRLIRLASKVSSGTVVWIAIPCSSWSSLQYLNEHRYGTQWLEEKQRKALPLVEAAVESARFALAHGVQVVWEWPYKLSGWKLQVVADLLSSLPHSIRIDACAYGFQHKGKPCKKPWLLRSSMPLKRLERLCACTIPHIPCEGGGHVAKSARYTESMAKAAVRSLFRALRSQASANASETDDDEDDDGDDDKPPMDVVILRVRLWMKMRWETQM
eukprot:3007661-Amphidinium_carterae.3